jgi:hypothetical protein
MHESTTPQSFLDSLATVPGKFSDRARLTVTATSEVLEVTPRAVRVILESGALSDLRSDRIVGISRKKVFVKGTGMQPVLRTGSGSIDPSTNRPIGYNASMTDAEVLEANRMWWRADANKIVNAGYLPVSIGSLIVALLRIDGLEESVRFDAPDKNGDPGKEVRHSFKAELVARYNGDRDEVVMCHENPTELDRGIAEGMLGRLHRAVSGGPIAYL